MPSPQKSTPQATENSPFVWGERMAKVVSEFEAIAAIEPSLSGDRLWKLRAQLKQMLEQLVGVCHDAGEEVPSAIAKRAVDMGIRAASKMYSVDEAERIAAKLVPDIRPGQAREIAAAKKRIGGLVSVLLTAQAEARAIIGALHTGHATPAGEPTDVACATPEEVAELEPGRYCIELLFSTLQPSGVFAPSIFTRAADELAAEVSWATEVEEQLGDMIRRLGELAVRNEERKLLRRRALIVEYLSPGSCSAARLADD